MNASFLAPPMIVHELLKNSASHLRQGGITNPKTSSEILLAHTLAVRRVDLYIEPDREVTCEEKKTFDALCERRFRHEPLQQILGETEFMSLPFTVNEHVLIPRPETELLVERVVSFCRDTWKNGRIRILDIGTGSGNIAVSLAFYLPSAEVTAFDISPEAVALARKNARSNGVSERIDFSVLDILSLRDDDYHDCHVVVSNPPYISDSERQYVQREVVEYEPHGALFPGGDGLKFYRPIARLAFSWLLPGGILACETGFAAGEPARDIVAEAGFGKVCLDKDYAGYDRILTGIR